jgi:protein-S-isoprenylcysteine O-methyltransferase Ste14
MTIQVKEPFVVLRGIVVATLFVWLWSWLASVVRRYDPALGASIPEWLRPLGFVLAVAGGALAATCVALFVTRGQGTPAPFDPPQRFVASGPYRYVRNPMYVGAICVLLGAGLVVQSPAIVLLAAGFWLLAHLFVVLYEEPALAHRFGESYVRYRSQVSRWLPRVPRSPR